MIEAPGMLMIGSAGRNSGKTEFACSLIRKYRPKCSIVGIKVTAVEERDGQCPRGGEGCGVCSSLEGNYLITEETNAGPGKDTERLLAAGATSVYWLRVLKAHLEEGAEALFRTVDPAATVICESNSLRTLVEPALFLMFRHKSERSFKESARAVRHCANRLVTFDGSGLDMDLGAVDLVEGRWTMRGNGNGSGNGNAEKPNSDGPKA